MMLERLPRLFGLSLLVAMAACAAPNEEETLQATSNYDVADTEGGGGGYDLTNPFRFVSGRAEGEALARAWCRAYRPSCANQSFREVRGKWEEKVTNAWTVIANGGPGNDTNPAGTVTFVHHYKAMVPRDAAGYCPAIYPPDFQGPTICFPYDKWVEVRHGNDNRP